MSKWQPIETAPNDGRILLTDGEEVAIGYSDGPFWMNQCNQSGGDGYSAYPTIWMNPKPTHWMPLPDPPKEPGA